uniref:JNK1/MAPK8-associated membrane protein n=1 Tax=Timema douglasi TaxID=61478 RepID=A0A7R8VP90_TIMDO|nr:unnamed protein product [Timema douglasi]
MIWIRSIPTKVKINFYFHNSLSLIQPTPETRAFHLYEVVTGASSRSQAQPSVTLRSSRLPLGDAVRPSSCPGIYCGRHYLPDGNWSDCGACPRGYRTNSYSICVKCEDSPEFYDWLYLGFMVLLALVLHWFCIDTAALRRRFVDTSLRLIALLLMITINFCKEVFALHLSALVETAMAAVLTLLMSEPWGKLEVRSCRTQKLSDWYTLLHNPNPDYADTLHCTQEAVYPLYTMVFIFYALSIVLMLLMRPWLAGHFLPVYGKMSIYAALYFFPTLALIQAVLGGLIYYSFPYMVIIMSVISNAAHFAFKLDQISAFKRKLFAGPESDSQTQGMLQTIAYTNNYLFYGWPRGKVLNFCAGGLGFNLQSRHRFI